MEHYFVMYFVHICLKNIFKKKRLLREEANQTLIITKMENMEKVISEVNDGPDKSLK